MAEQSALLFGVIEICQRLAEQRAKQAPELVLPMRIILPGDE